MSDFKVIVQPTDPGVAKSQLRAWLDRNVSIRAQLGEEDLILDEIFADGGQVKHGIRRRTISNRRLANQT